MRTVNVPPVILAYAVRYALNRRTYAVSDVTAAVRANIGSLGQRDLSLLASEIDRYLIDVERHGGGSDIDDPQWRTLLADIDALLS